jgi:hypothetical protein
MIPKLTAQAEMKRALLSFITDHTFVNRFLLKAEIKPVKADAATVNGLARYKLPGPERP